MEGVLTRAAANSDVVIAPLIQLIDEVRMSDHNRLLEDKLSRMEKLLQDIFNQFQDKQRSLPDTIKNLLQGQLRDCLNDAKGIVVRTNRKKRFLDHLFRSARVSSTELRDWNTNCDQLFTNLERNVSIFPDAQLPKQLLQPVSVQALLEPNFVWPGITSAEKQLDTWLNEEDHQLHVIGIYGIGGIGKTSLLKKVYNKYKKGNVFQEVIWITVSKKYDILELQSVIANTINLKLGSTSHAESSSAAQMKLSSCLKEVKFLLFLDDMWTPFLQEESDDMWSRSIWEEKVGIPFGRSKGSKVVISSRSIDVIQRMGKNARYYMPLQLLFSEEEWQLFCRVAFKSGSPPSDSIKDVARKFATECKGFPLAINVVAAAMACNHSVIEWTLALLQRKTLDSVLPSLTTNGIDELDLCEQIKWSYDHLPDSTSKNCFLYCAAFPKDEEIDVETLLEMWIGEGLFQMGKPSYFMDIGRRYVNPLVDRCLFEIVDRADMKYIKVHHVVRDMAILIGENEENCLFKTTQCLQKFPANEKVEHCKRITVSFTQFCHAGHFLND